MLKHVTDVKECPDCASTNIAINAKKEQVICRDCGVIFEPLAPAEEKQFEKARGRGMTKKAAKKR